MSIISLKGRFTGQEIVDAQREYLEPEELKRLWSVLKPDPFWFGYFRLQYYFGCRISEIALILKEDVSFKDNGIIIRRLKKLRFPIIRYKDETGRSRTRIDRDAKPSEGFKQHVYSLNPALEKIVKDVIKVAPKDNPWLFGSTSTRKNLSNIRLTDLRTVVGENNYLYRAISRHSAHNAFKEATANANIPERLRHSHVLRHTRATLMLAAGAPPADVKHLLDHSDMSVTEGYMHVAKQLRMRLETSAELAFGDVDDT